MRVAISSKGSTTDNEIDDRFGRCAYFIIVETNKKGFQFVEALKNKSAERSGGAGSFAAKMIAEKNVDAVITGEIGPNALQVLDQFKIKIIRDSGNIAKALMKFLEEL
ncbi:NifB/NifX family molybdenum-iron cluster-binding protein [Candidatus Woesearchaeota archaeon]|nr:NifB/NifX family molybdenum-iron cluster-binding protein [Candidatus Woesearchaeota archaeon]